MEGMRHAFLRAGTPSCRLPVYNCRKSLGSTIGLDGKETLFGLQAK